MSVLVRGMETFVMVTPDQFLFGYDDTLVTLANIANTLLHINWPAPRIMSLLKGVSIAPRSAAPPRRRISRERNARVAPNFSYHASNCLILD